MKCIIYCRSVSCGNSKHSSSKDTVSKDSVFIFVLPDRDYFARSIRARNNERSQSS